MRALIVSNCATSAYTETLRQLHPQWDVRGVNINLARKWFESSEKPEFIAFHDSADFLISIAPEIRKTDAKVIKIPGFFFRGLHPDSFHLNGTPSVLDPGGNLQSRIAAVAYLLGKSAEETASYFNEAVFKRAGYLDVYQSEKMLTLKVFADNDIRIDDLFETWERSGNFLHQYNHPKVRVLVDIFLRAINEAIPHSHPVLTVRDELADSTIWPIYPGIGRNLSIEGALEWRRSVSFNFERLSVSEFVSRSFVQFRTGSRFEKTAIPGFEIVAGIL